MLRTVQAGLLATFQFTVPRVFTISGVSQIVCFPLCFFPNSDHFCGGEVAATSFHITLVCFGEVGLFVLCCVVCLIVLVFVVFEIWGPTSPNPCLPFCGFVGVSPFCLFPNED